MKMAYRVNNLVLRGASSAEVHGGRSVEITRMEEFRAV